MIVLSTTYAQYHKGYGQYMVFRVGSRSTSKGGQNIFIQLFKYLTSNK